MTEEATRGGRGEPPSAAPVLPAPLDELLALAVVGSVTWAAIVLFVALLAGVDARIAAPGAALAGCAVEAVGLLRRRPGIGGAGRPVSAWELVSAAAALLALGLALVKQCRAPLWSWDHFAMWGLAAQVLLDEGRLDLARIPGQDIGFVRHELGLPLVWWLAGGARELSETVVRSTHAATTLVLFALARSTCARSSGDRTLGWSLAGLLALTPLFWDTVLVGLADLPLALWALAAVRLASNLESRGEALRAGAVLGFLPWLKQEGLFLCAGLAVGLCIAGSRRWSGRGHRWIAWCLSSCAVVGAIGVAAPRRLLPPWPGLVSSGWLERAAERSDLLGELAGEAASRLASLEWMGLWIALIVAVPIAWRRGRALPALVGSVVVAQLALYLAVIHVAWPEPASQLDAAWTRLAAGVAPLALVCVAAAFGNRDRSSGSSAPAG